MSTVQQIADQLRASNFEHVRAIIEPDDVMVLIDYLESQGFISAEARAAAEAAKAEAAEKTEAIDFEAMTKDELLDYAALHGVEVAKSKTKAEIIEAIESESK